MPLVRHSRPGAAAGAALLIAACALAPLAAPAAAQGTGAIAGRVTTRGAATAGDTLAALPVANALVSVSGLARETTTGADGRFFLDRVPEGARQLRVRLVGFRAATRDVRVRAGDTARVDVALAREAQLLAPVRTDARAADAEAFVTRPSIATVNIAAAEMAGVPKVGEPDVVRVVQLLPGVVSRNDFNTGLNVRGGEADQNLVLLDGHIIYNPFHLGGLFSTFMDATVGGLELMTGAFPSRYGGRLSSVLDVRSAVETRPGTHATADISALGATGRLAGTFGDGRGAWSLAGRRTYADAMTSLFTSNIFPYHFRDFHGRASWATPSGFRVAVTGYLGKDVLDANLAEFDTDSAPSKASAGSWAFDWGNQVLGLTLAKDLGNGARLLFVPLGDSATIEQRVSTSGFATRLDLGEGSFEQRSSIRDLRVSGSLTVRTASHQPAIGYEVATHRIRYASAAPQTGITNFDVEQSPTAGVLWASDLWRIGSRVLLEGGVRAEALSGRQWAAVSPRASIKVFATPDLALTLGGGRITQWLHSLAGDGPLRYFDVWLASDERTPVALAWHGIAGVEQRFATSSVKIEGYVKRYDRILEADPSEDPRVRGDEFFDARGQSYGADLLARYQRGTRLSGWVSYSYGVSTRWRRDDGRRWSPGHDRRHDVDVVSSYLLGKYRLGGRFGFATGTPFTPIVGEITRRVYDPAHDTWGTGDPRIFVESIGGIRNGARFPPTHRLDLDASREFRIRGATFAPYVSLANAYFARNVFVYIYDYSTERPTRRAISQFPILPSVGARVAF